MTESIVREPDHGQGSPQSAVGPTLGSAVGTTLSPAMNPTLNHALSPAVISAASPAVISAVSPNHVQAARDLGTRWALEIRRSLRLEKRRAAGGWPGTKREAHARATWLVATLQSGQVERSFHTTTVTDLATAVYASAKSTWLANAEEEDEDSDVE